MYVLVETRLKYDDESGEITTLSKVVTTSDDCGKISEIKNYVQEIEDEATFSIFEV